MTNSRRGARLLKAGKRLVVGDVVIAPDGEGDAPVAHVVMTYSVPPGAEPTGSP